MTRFRINEMFTDVDASGAYGVGWAGTPSNRAAYTRPSQRFARRAFFNKFKSFDQEFAKQAQVHLVLPHYNTLFIPDWKLHQETFDDFTFVRYRQIRSSSRRLEYTTSHMWLSRRDFVDLKLLMNDNLDDYICPENKHGEWRFIKPRRTMFTTTTSDGTTTTF